MAKKQQTPDYEQLGKMLQSVIETGYVDKRAMFKMSFLKGLVAGLGGVVGATLVLAVLLWLLSVLHYVPLLNTITDNVQCTLQQSERSVEQPTRRCDD